MAIISVAGINFATLSIQQGVSFLLLIVFYFILVSIFGNLFFGEVKIQKKENKFFVDVPLITFPLSKKFEVVADLKEVRIGKVWKQNFYLDQYMATLVFSNNETIELYPASIKWAFINFRTAFDLRKEDAEQIAKLFGAKVTEK